MNRRNFLGASALLPLSLPAVGAAVPPPVHPGSAEITLDGFAADCRAGRLSSRELTAFYLARIAEVDHRGPMLGAVLETNPAALEIAAALDAERAAKGARGPLHGVPVLIKDNIETADRMMTTAGSLALEGWYAPTDAPLVARLRAAGAVVLGKTNLSEWANFRSTRSVSGWSGRGGQTRNPYSLDRSPSGSSSGSAVAVAAGLCAVAVGTETNGSIVSPASINGIVGIKPTVGLVSRSGVVPISHTQDTPGPLARTVKDAVLLLGALAGPDPADPANRAVGDRFDADYTRYLRPDGLNGARLGIARKFFADNAPLDRFLNTCVATLERAGAVIVDPAELPAHGEADAPSFDVLLYEFKADLDAYLARLPASMPVRSLADLIRFNESHAARELGLFDQELLRKAEATPGLSAEAYVKALAAARTASRDHGIDAALAEHRLDALVTLTSGPAWLIDPIDGDGDAGGCSTPAAVAGYPHVTVPAGLYRGLPVGLSFFAGAFSEPTLIRLASGFEHVARARIPPRWPVGA
jgi:amidase